MSNIKRVTAFQAHTTAEGERLAFTYSIINEDGQLVASNKRAEIIVLNENILNDINEIYEFLYSKIPE